jgi:hypothetical protein
VETDVGAFSDAKHLPMPWSGCRNWELTLEDPVPPIQTPIWANIGSDWCDAKMDSWNTPWCLPVRRATKYYDVPKWDEGTRDWRSCCGSKRSFRNFHPVQDGGGLGNDGPDGVVYRSCGSRNWNDFMSGTQTASKTSRRNAPSSPLRYLRDLG